MERLQEAVRRKRTDLCGGEWLFHHDNAPVHSTLLFCDFLTKHETTLNPPPLHLPGLAIANFFLFTKLKSITKG
jgi:hypothetical protein